MSINILKEFLIHFHTFRNVDLINQGLYQIRSRIFYTEKNLKYMALPYFFVDSKESENTLLTDEQNIKPHNIISNHISENSSEYVTKTFLIRYSDEEVELDEFCYFRIEVPYSKIKIPLIYHIEFELFFSDALMHINKEKKSGQNVLNNVEFKSVSNQVILINFEGNGYLESFTPIVYSDSFSSTLNSSVHMIVLDYKLRVNNLKPFSVEENINTSTNNNVSNIKNDQDKNKSNSHALKNSRSNNYLNNSGSLSPKKKSNINSLIQFFLDEKFCDYKLEHKVIDELYEKYVLSLVKNYLSLRIKYKRLVNKLLDEKMKSELPFFVFIQPLTFFMDEKDKELASTIGDEFSFNQIHSSMGILSSRINDFTSEYISSRILLEINYIGGQIYQLWHKYIELIRFFPTQTNYLLYIEYLTKYKEDLNKFVKKSVVNVNDTMNLLLPVENNIAELNKIGSIELRASIQGSYFRPSIENLTHHIKPSSFPILFEESYVSKVVAVESKKSFYDNHVLLNQDKPNEDFSVFSDSIEFDTKRNLSLHLIVLVHGFQGNSYDMRLIKNSISLINPSCVFLPSNSNQDDTECDIEDMGKKLANEVRTYVKEWSDGVIFKKISFIGHSIGGLIIRAALPYLKDFSDKFWLYMSLSSPHLGYIYSTSSLIDAGLWILKTWKKSKSLEQLSFSDAKEMKDCCIFRMSDFEGLNWFRHVYLISSHQDLYAPYESTRIQLCSKSLTDSHRADIYRNMAYNILSKLSKDSVKRVDVNFVIPEKNLDSFIGRTAHIQFLENLHFMKILFYLIEDLLK